MAAESRKRGLDGVICGHIHKPEIREIGGMIYCNDGDWVESLSALVEEHSGALRLVSWQEIMQFLQHLHPVREPDALRQAMGNSWLVPPF